MQRRRWLFYFKRITQRSFIPLLFSYPRLPAVLSRRALTGVGSQLQKAECALNHSAHSPTLTLTHWPLLFASRCLRVRALPPAGGRPAAACAAAAAAARCCDRSLRHERRAQDSTTQQTLIHTYPLRIRPRRASRHVAELKRRFGDRCWVSPRGDGIEVDFLRPGPVRVLH